MRTDYLGLEAFVAVAELGSFGRAAAFLNITPTALSHRIKKLEADLGVQMIVRTTREVSLTKVAQDLLPVVRQDLGRISESYARLMESGRAQEDRLAVACLPTVAYSHLSAILPEFAREYREMTVQLYDQPVARIYDLVEKGEAEFGITIVTARRWDLDIREIYTEPYLVLMRKDHPLAEKTQLRRADLTGLPFVRINTQSTNRQLVDEGLGEYGEGMVWRYEVQNPVMALNLVAEGAALTVLPAMTTTLTWKNLVARPLSDVRMTRTIGVATRRGSPLSPPGRRLLQMIEASLSNS